jgi:hypothetical protein
MLYFALASVWGFVTGSAAVLGGFVMVGRPVELGMTFGATLAIAVPIAMVGGAIVSLAYREAVRRQS